MSQTRSEHEQVESILRPDIKGPFLMITLLNFRETTTSGERGESVYARFLGRILPIAERLGARLVWYGEAKQVFAGTADEGWDRAHLVEWPSRAAFMKMVETPEYQSGLVFRDTALAKLLMLVSSPIGAGT